MTRILRRLRGIIVTGLIWSFAWSIAGSVLSVLMLGPYIRDTQFVLGILPTALLFYSLVGMWTGVAFASVLSFGDRRRTFAELTMPRVATWGALGGVSYPLTSLLLTMSLGGIVPSDLGAALGITALLGAGSAAAMLALARRREQLVSAGGSLPRSGSPE